MAIIPDCRITADTHTHTQGGRKRVIISRLKQAGHIKHTSHSLGIFC